MIHICRALVEVVDEPEIEIPDNVNAQAMERGLKDMLVEYAAKEQKDVKRISCADCSR